MPQSEANSFDTVKVGTTLNYDRNKPFHNICCITNEAKHDKLEQDTHTSKALKGITRRIKATHLG